MGFTPMEKTTVDAVNPATEKLIATIALCSPNEVDRAVGAALRSRPRWARPMTWRIVRKRNVDPAISARRSRAARV
jgi:acyl-CoA reductase-like NAD-dependent aldehyde dehydrogenase